ncbi:acyl carrier protein [Rhodoblastus sp.]|uniref:acyl carrier protein n=1 Tax=Rhodoblastus sp. TaxID=1962975 RepID=UPI003F9A1054
MTRKIETDLRAFIAQDLLFQDDMEDLAGDQSMLQAGMIDSTGVLELVSYLESHFGIRIHDAEIVPDNLDTVDALVAFVAKKVGAATSAAA